MFRAVTRRVTTLARRNLSTSRPKSLTNQQHPDVSSITATTAPITNPPSGLSAQTQSHRASCEDQLAHFASNITPHPIPSVTSHLLSEQQNTIRQLVQSLKIIDAASQRSTQTPQHRRGKYVARDSNYSSHSQRKLPQQFKLTSSHNSSPNWSPPRSSRLRAQSPIQQQYSIHVTSPITTSIRAQSTNPNPHTMKQYPQQQPSMAKPTITPRTSPSPLPHNPSQSSLTTTHTQSMKLFRLNHPDNPRFSSIMSPNYPLFPLSAPFLTLIPFLMGSSMYIGVDIGKTQLDEQVAKYTQHQWEDDPDYVALTVGLEQDGDQTLGSLDTSSTGNISDDPAQQSGQPTFVQSVLDWSAKLVHLPAFYLKRSIEFTSRVVRTLVLLGYMLPPVCTLFLIGMADLACYFYFLKITIPSHLLTLSDQLDTASTPTPTSTSTSASGSSSPQATQDSISAPALPEPAPYPSYTSPQLIQSVYSLWWRFFKKTLQGAGATFTKLGQYLSSRPDILSPEICEILSDLQSENEIHLWEFTQHMIENEFGPNWNEFLYITPSDVCGSGCIAQVYRGMFNLSRYLELEEMDRLEAKLMSGEFDDELVALYAKITGACDPSDMPLSDDPSLMAKPTTLDLSALGYRPGHSSHHLLFSTNSSYLSPQIRSWLSQSGIDLNAHGPKLQSSSTLSSPSTSASASTTASSTTSSSTTTTMATTTPSSQPLNHNHNLNLKPQPTIKLQSDSDDPQVLKVDATTISNLSETHQSGYIVQPVHPFSIEQTTAFLDSPQHEYKLSGTEQNLTHQDRARMTRRIRSSVETGSLYTRHLASNPDDTILTVAVKVLHPDSVYSINRDLNILTSIVGFAELLPFAKLQFASPAQLCAEFSRLMRTQLSMHQESLNLRRFNTSFQTDLDLGLNPNKKDPSKHPPSPYETAVVAPAFPLALVSSPSILVETYHSGIPMSDFLQLESVGDQNAKVLSQTQYVDQLYALSNIYHKSQFEARYGVEWDQLYGKTTPTNPHTQTNNDIDDDMDMNMDNNTIPQLNPAPIILDDIRDDDYFHSHDKAATLPPTLHDLREIQQKEIAAHLSPRQLSWLRKEYAQIGLQTFLTMCFHNGFFHSDLHPGNMIVDLGYDIMDPVTLQSTLEVIDILNGQFDPNSCNTNPTNGNRNDNNNDNGNDNNNNDGVPRPSDSTANNSTLQFNPTDAAFAPRLPHHSLSSPSILSPFFKKTHAILAQSAPILYLSDLYQYLSNQTEASAGCNVMGTIREAVSTFDQHRSSLNRWRAVQEQFFQERAWDPSKIFPDGVFGMIHPHSIAIMPSYDNHHDMHYRSYFYQHRIPQPAHKPRVILIDVGMSTVLTKRDKTNFNDLFYAIAMGRGYEAAAMMIERAQPTCDISQLSETELGAFYGAISTKQAQFLEDFNRTKDSNAQIAQQRFENADWLGKRRIEFDNFLTDKKAHLLKIFSDFVGSALLCLTSPDDNSVNDGADQSRTIFGSSLVSPKDIKTVENWSTMHPADTPVPPIAPVKGKVPKNAIPSLVPFTTDDGKDVMVNTNGTVSTNPCDHQGGGLTKTVTPLETLHITDDVYINLQSIPYNPFQSRENRKAFILHVGDLILDVRKKNFQLDSVGVVSILTSLISASRDYCIKLDTSFISLVIAVIVFEGVGRQLDAQLDIISPALSIIIKTQLEELSSVANTKLDEANILLEETMTQVEAVVKRIDDASDNLLSDGIAGLNSQNEQILRAVGNLSSSTFDSVATNSVPLSPLQSQSSPENI